MIDSGEKFLNSLVEFAEVNKQLTEVNEKYAILCEDESNEEDPADLEKEMEMLEKVVDVMKQNLDHVLRVQEEVRLLEELHMEVISEIRTRISKIKNKKPVLEAISKMSYEELIYTENMIKNFKIKSK